MDNLALTIGNLGLLKKKNFVTLKVVFYIYEESRWIIKTCQQSLNQHNVRLPDYLLITEAMKGRVVGENWLAMLCGRLVNTIYMGWTTQSRLQPRPIKATIKDIQLSPGIH